MSATGFPTTTLARPRTLVPGRSIARAWLLFGVVAAVSVTTAPAYAEGLPAHAQGLSVAEPPEVSAELLSAASDEASARSGHSRHRIFFVFTKNHADPTNSRLALWRVRTRSDQPPRLQEVRSWRAGSGVGREPGGANACATNRGWLPNGWYDAHPDEAAFDTDFEGNLIFGITWRLQDKACPGGTVRTQLYIHSEMTSDRKQRCDPDDYRENQCWDGNEDYVSAGCIKLSYRDIKKAAKLARRSGGPKAGQQQYRRLLFVMG